MHARLIFAALSASAALGLGSVANADGVTPVAIPNAVPLYSEIGGGSYSYSLTTSPSVSVTANYGSCPLGGCAGAGAQSQLTYYFEIVTPNNYTGPLTQNVFLTAMGNASTSATGMNGGGVNVEAFMQVSGFGISTIDDEVQMNFNTITSDSYVEGTGVITTNNPPTAMAGSFSENGTELTVTVDDVYEIIINALTPQACSAGNGSASCAASVDPTITAPGLPNGLTLEFSPNLAATPLPAALPLFASGLGALGLFGWRRKRNSAAVAAA
ncbi:MAG TPA: VPLPA-CTERM sorting domain-containing protein [Burkholderiaceae bacterium]|nr:VPLPA-CTERM sorting domain-containing protein [Burkholderiaceae bacterium]